MPGTAGTPYIGQIMMVGFSFNPQGWALCNGQLMAISQNAALFTLIGTTYGGDGQTTFALPDLRGRVPIHPGVLSGGGDYLIGQKGGTEMVTIIAATLPLHQHLFNPVASQSEPTTEVPAGNYPAVGGYYATTTNSVAPMGAATLAAVGGSQPHNNIQPYLGINFIISLFGIFPTS